MAQSNTGLVTIVLPHPTKLSLVPTVPTVPTVLYERQALVLFGFSHFYDRISWGEALLDTKGIWLVAAYPPTLVCPPWWFEMWGSPGCVTGQLRTQEQSASDSTGKSEWRRTWREDWPQTIKCCALDTVNHSYIAPYRTLSYRRGTLFTECDSRRLFALLFILYTNVLHSVF